MQSIFQVMNKLNALRAHDVKGSGLTKLQSRYLMANAALQIIYPGGSAPPLSRKFRCSLVRYGVEQYWRLPSDQRSIEDGMFINSGSAVNCYTAKGLLIFSNQPVLISKCDVSKHTSACGGHVKLPSSCDSYQEIVIGRDTVNPRSFLSGMILTPQGCYPDYPYVAPVVLPPATVHISMSPFIRVVPCNTFVPKLIVPTYIASSYTVTYTQRPVVLSVTLSYDYLMKFQELLFPLFPVPISWPARKKEAYSKCVVPRVLEKLPLNPGRNQFPNDFYKGFLSYFLINQHWFVSHCHENDFPSLEFAIGSLNLHFEESFVLSIVYPHYHLYDLDVDITGDDYDITHHQQTMVLGFQADFIAKMNGQPPVHTYLHMYGLPPVHNAIFDHGFYRTKEFVVQERVEAHRFVNLISSFRLDFMSSHIKENVSKDNDLILTMSRMLRFVERIVLAPDAQTGFLDYLNINGSIVRAVHNLTIIQFLKENPSSVPTLVELITTRLSAEKPPFCRPTWSLYRDNPISSEDQFACGLRVKRYFTSVLDPTIFDGPVKLIFNDYLSNFSLNDFMAVCTFMAKRAWLAKLVFTDYFSLLFYYAKSISGYNNLLPISVYYQLYFLDYFRVKCEDGYNYYFDAMYHSNVQADIKDFFHYNDVSFLTDYDFPH